MVDDRTQERFARGRALAKSVGGVLFVLAIVRLALRLLGIDVPGIPLPGRPDLPDLPDVPDLPAWVHPVVNWGTLAVVIVIVLLLAGSALARRRKAS